MDDLDDYSDNSSETLDNDNKTSASMCESKQVNENVLVNL